jgi:hypothetical protein
MKTLLAGRSLLVLAAFTVANFAQAQFQNPTQEELKMTADPKAPGAAALYLNVEETADDPLHFHSVHERIKILTEKGKELATVEIPYVRGNRKIADIKGRTIHADGTIVPLAVKPEDLMVEKNGEMEIGKKVFTLPSAEVGSILEYYYQEQYDENHFSSPFWEIQRPYPVVKAHYVFTPFKAFQPGIQNQTSSYLTDEHGYPVNKLMWWTVLPKGVNVDRDMMGHFSVDVENIPAEPHEEWMPPQHSFRSKVLFYYTSAHSTPDFWSQEEKFWSKDVEHFSEPSKAIQEAVSGIVLPTDSEMEKAKKLYKAVQALDNTDFSRKKGTTELKDLKQKEVKRADEVWAQKSGSGEQIAMLYLAMARAAGLHAYAMDVANREDSIFDPNYLYMGQLDQRVIGLSIGGKELVTDPGQKMCPFLMLHWKHAAASGMRQSSDSNFLVNLPEQGYLENKLIRLGEINVDEQGGMTGTLQFNLSGQQALYWRQKALRNDMVEVKKSFDEWLVDQVPEGVEAHVDHFVAMDDPDAVLIAMINAKGTPGAATAKRVMLPGLFFATRSGHPFVNSENRQTPVDMHYPDQVTDQVTYHLPDGMSVEGAPRDDKFGWPQHAAFTVRTAQAPGKITVARQLSRAFTFATAAEYQDLRGFYQKIASADQQQIVLTRTVAEKGN